MFSEHRAPRFRFAPEIGRNLCYLSWILCRVSKDGTRQRILYRVPAVGHSAKILKKLNTFFVECLEVGTRQRSLCRVSDPGHSTKCIFKLKKSLPSACDLALGKAGKYYYQRFSLTLSLSLHSISQPPPLSRPASPHHRRRRALTPRPAAATPPPPAPTTTTAPATCAPAVTTVAPTPVNSCFILIFDIDAYLK
jgi:hypothetical protein